MFLNFFVTVLFAKRLLNSKETGRGDQTPE